MERRELNAGIMQHRPRICVNECGCRVCIEVEEGEAVWIEPGCLCPKAPFIVRCNQHPVGREVVPPSVLPWDIPNRPIQIRCDGGVEKKADVSGAVVPQWSISVCEQERNGDDVGLDAVPPRVVRSITVVLNKGDGEGVITEVPPAVHRLTDNACSTQRAPLRAAVKVEASSTFSDSEVRSCFATMLMPAGS